MAKVEYAGAAIEETAGEAIGGNRAIAIVAGEAWHADPADAAHRHGVRGISTGAVSLGGTVCIQIAGPMEELSWSWTPDQPVFTTANGVLTQTAPASGAVVQLGVARTATVIDIDVQPPLVKA